MGRRIVMLGAPGAGKGTQAVRIAARLAVPHISTGDIFRAHLKNGTAIGRQVQPYLDAGQLVPDELTCAIVADRLQADDCRGGYVLDGFPRSVPQAEMLTKLLRDHGDDLDMAIDIAVPDEEIVGRLAARRFCPKCGKIFNLKFSPSGNGKKCDAPGATDPSSGVRTTRKRRFGNGCASTMRRRNRLSDITGIRVFYVRFRRPRPARTTCLRKLKSC